MTWRPVELEMEGFGSFVDKTLIPFPKAERGAILINGSYKDGTTSSGSGKSTILRAIAYALDFCDIPSTELKSWYTKKFYVRFRLTNGTDILDVIRNPKLTLILNEVEYEGTTLGAKEKLQEILKAPSDLVKVLTYRPQREQGVFLSSSDSKLKEFFTEVLGLQEVENAASDYLSEINVLKNNIIMMESNLESLKMGLNTSQVTDEQLKTAKDDYDNASLRVRQLNDVGSSIKANSLEIQQVEAELVKINTAKNQIANSKNQNLAIRSTIERIQKEVAVLQSGTCPTCEREWNKAQNLILSKQAEINQYLESLKSNIALIKSAEVLVNLEHEAAMNAKRTALHTQLGQLQAPLNDATKHLSVAEANFTQMSRSRDNYNNLVQQVKIKEQELLNKKIELDQISHCSAILGRQGFLGVIFDEVLCEVKNRSNDIMGYMPNINTFSLDISSNSVTQKGKVNKKIKVSVKKDGEDKSIKALSGGQCTGIELCTDLAVSETIRSRFSSNLGWVALDESMDGLDVNTKMAALDVIKSKVDGIIIVVDHSTEIKEAFDSVINVEYDGRKSCVV